MAKFKPAKGRAKKTRAPQGGVPCVILVISGMLLVFIPLSGDYITASVLGGAKGTMVGQFVYEEFLTAQNWAVGSAMAMILMGMILAAVLIFGAVFFIVSRVLRQRRKVVLAPLGATA